MLRVEVSQQGQASQTYNFDKGRIQVGRGNDCDLVLTAPGISTVHAQIVAGDGRCVVIDQNSTNGTYLHGAPIHGPTNVMPYEGVYICSYCLHIEALPEQTTNSAKAQVREEPPMLNMPAPARRRRTEPQAPPFLGSNRAQRDETTTIAPKGQDEESKRRVSQKISVQPNARFAAPSHSEHKIEMRRWAIPGAPAHASHDQSVLARVFAGLAQPFVEAGRLPPGDEASRASFYALAQAQLSINLSPQSTQMERGAERIVQSLCAIGPLTDVLASGVLASAHQELLARPFEPIKVRNTQTPGPWQCLDQAFIHPWAIRFAATRMLGRELDPQAPLESERLSHGLTLSLLSPFDVAQGPWLILRSAPVPGKDWASYCEATQLSDPLQGLLRAVVHSRTPILVCESSRSPVNLWSALHELGSQRRPIGHIGWDPNASYAPQALNFCAQQDPARQSEQWRMAQRMGMTSFISVDRPTAPCLQAMAGATAVHPGWLRVQESSTPEALRGVQSAWLPYFDASSSTESVGLCIRTSHNQTGGPSKINRIEEFYLDSTGSLVLNTICELQGDALVFAGTSSRLPSSLAQQGFELAPLS